MRNRRRPNWDREMGYENDPWKGCNDPIQKYWIKLGGKGAQSRHQVAMAFLRGSFMQPLLFLHRPHHRGPKQRDLDLPKLTQQRWQSHILAQVSGL